MPVLFTPAARRRTRGFTLVEVILALAIMAVAIVSILGLIGETLTKVRQAEEIAAGTVCIDKMNALIQNTPFWDDTTAGQGECVYNWIVKSSATSPTVFVFYNITPDTTSTITGDAPVQRVIRFNSSFQAISTPSQTYAMNKPDANVPQLPVYDTLDNFVTDVTNGRIDGPVIAMTLSPSPLMNNFPTVAEDGSQEGPYYLAPTNDLLFPSQVNMPDDPTGQNGNHKIYPEAYLPIYVQAFVVSLTNIQPNEDSNSLTQSLVDNLTEGNRLFTYTTAKLR